MSNKTLQSLIDEIKARANATTAERLAYDALSREVYENGGIPPTAEIAQKYRFYVGFIKGFQVGRNDIPRLVAALERLIHILALDVGIKTSLGDEIESILAGEK